MRFTRFVPLAVCLAACTPTQASSSEQPLAGASTGETASTSPEPYYSPGYWQGAIEVPNGPAIEWIIAVEMGDDGVLEAKIWIPQQEVRGIGLAEPQLADPEGLRFDWAEIGASWVIVSGDAPRCSFTQAGAVLDCDVEAIDAQSFAEYTVLSRPQQPKPPFPYAVEELRFENPDAEGVTLAATLTIPEGPGPHPGVILLTGSGLQDRDESLMGHKPFWVLADHLSRNGVAVLRYDDRGFPPSTGDPAAATMEDFASDGWAALQTLADRPEVDAERVGIIGHSEGGVTGPMIAAAHPKAVDFVVMMAGTGVRGDTLILRQTALQLRSTGATEEQIATQVATSETIFRTLREDPQNLDAAIETAVREGAAALPADQQMSPEELETEIRTQREVLESPWLRHFLGFDPAPTLREVKAPVLVLAGELDLQVEPEQNLGPIEAALRRNRHVKVVRFPGLNHLFQPATTGALSEYSEIETTLDPAVLEVITRWVRATTELD